MYIFISPISTDPHFLPYRYGIYPLTAYSARQPPPPRYLNFSPLTADSVKSVTPDPVELETRKIVNMICSVKPSEDGSTLLVIFTSFEILSIWKLTGFSFKFCFYQMTIFLRMEDALNRQLTCQISEDDSSEVLATELVHLGFINEVWLWKINYGNWKMYLTVFWIVT